MSFRFRVSGFGFRVSSFEFGSWFGVCGFGLELVVLGSGPGFDLSNSHSSPRAPYKRPRSGPPSPRRPRGVRLQLETRNSKPGTGCQEAPAAPEHPIGSRMVLAGALVTSGSPTRARRMSARPSGDESPGALTTRNSKLETRNWVPGGARAHLTTNDSL